MSFLDTLRGTGSRRAVDKVDELRDENRRLLTAYHAAGDEIALLRNDLTVARTNQGKAEELVVQLQADKDELTEERNQLVDEARALRAELAPHRAAEANANAVTVPPMERDTRAVEDQATAPAGIDVKPLWEALAVTDPGQVRQTTWGRDTDTQPLPKLREAS